MSDAIAAKKNYPKMIKDTVRTVNEAASCMIKVAERQKELEGLYIAKKRC